MEHGVPLEISRMFAWVSNLFSSRTWKGYDRRIVAGDCVISDIWGASSPEGQDFLHRICGKYSRTSHNKHVDVVLEQDMSWLLKCGTPVVGVWIKGHRVGNLSWSTTIAMSPYMNGERWRVSGRITGGRWINQHRKDYFRLSLLLTGYADNGSVGIKFH